MAPYRITRPASGRKSVTKATAETASEAGAQPDDGLRPYLNRLMKLIPAEVLSLYLVGSGMIDVKHGVALAIWGAFCLFGVILVRIYGTADPEKGVGPDYTHVAISAIAFVIWIYSMGGPFEGTVIHEPYIGSLLILGFTFLTPYLYRGPAPADDNPNPG